MVIQHAYSHFSLSYIPLIAPATSKDVKISKNRQTHPALEQRSRKRTASSGGKSTMMHLFSHLYRLSMVIQHAYSHFSLSYIPLIAPATSDARMRFKSSGMFALNEPVAPVTPMRETT
jgi:tryptophan synthase alpha subunit